MGGGRIEWEEGGVGCTTQRINHQYISAPPNRNGVVGNETN